MCEVSAIYQCCDVTVCLHLGVVRDHLIFHHSSAKSVCLLYLWSVWPLYLPSWAVGTFFGSAGPNLLQ